MNNTLEYKGYHSNIEFDVESMTLRGKIEGITDFVDFESDSLENIEAEFHSAVDDYLQFCKEIGKEPDKEYKGLFNVRIRPELHRILAMEASKSGCTLNALVEKALEKYIDEKNEIKSAFSNMNTLISDGVVSDIGFGGRVCEPEGEIFKPSKDKKNNRP